MRLRAAREVCSSRRPTIFRVTGGSSSTASLNAAITLSARANMLSGGTVGSSPARISSRGCGTGSCAPAATKATNRMDRAINRFP